MSKQQGGKSRRQQQGLGPSQGPGVDRQQGPENQEGLGNAAATSGLGASAQSAGSAYPHLDQAALTLLGESLFASGASQAFLDTLGLGGLLGQDDVGEEQAADSAPDSEQAEEEGAKFTMPESVSDEAGYEFRVEGNGARYVLIGIPDGAPGRLGAEISADSNRDAWQKLTYAWFDAAIPVQAEVAVEATAVATEMVEQDDQLDATGSAGWLESGIDLLVQGARTADDLDRQYNPARWARDGITEHMAAAGESAWGFVGQGVTSATDWWAGGQAQGQGEDQASEEPAELTMEERFAQHQEGQAMLHTAVDKSEEDTNYTTGSSWLQTDADGMLKRDMTTQEGEDLWSGSEDADDFVCSTFAIWAFLATERDRLPADMPDEEKDERIASLLKTEIDTDYEGDDARSGHYGHEFSWDKSDGRGGTREKTEHLTFMSIGNTHLEAFERGRDGTSEVEHDRVRDAFDDSKADEGFTNDDLRVMGMAGALVLMGIADRVVDLDQVKPGDVMQSRGKTLAGHATMCHRVWCQGSGYFGAQAWFPKLLDPGAHDLTGADPSVGVWLEDVGFYIDEDTMPDFVGEYTQTAIDHIGAHNTGVASELSVDDDRKSGSNAGVFSRTTEGRAADHNDESKRMYAGRLHSSPWKLPHPPAAAPALEPAVEEVDPQQMLLEEEQSGWGWW